MTSLNNAPAQLVHAGEVKKAVVLARGLGTRMRLHDDSVVLDAEQTTAAGQGVKALIPLGRPFLDYVLSAVADAGYRDVCLVVGPEHHAIRDYYAKQLILKRLRIEFAVQARPLGTANAVAAARSFAGLELFLVLNSDNYYPVEALQALRTLGRPGAAVFEFESLVRQGNISPERVAQFAVVDTCADGGLLSIHEKPDPQFLASRGRECYVSMNCWLFGPSIFTACARIGPSPRNELELTDAVQFSIRVLGDGYHILKFRLGVVDLSTRADIPAVARRLRNITPCL